MSHRLLCVLILAAALPNAQSATIPAEQQKTVTSYGTVLQVVDGDTFVLRETGFLAAQKTIRFSAIDAPELSQTHGLAARAALHGLLSDATVRIDCYKQDARGREVCRVSIDGKDVALSMLRQGAAWHFKRFEIEQASNERNAYINAERSGRKAKRGLWAARNPMPPWDCRAALQALQNCR